MLCILQHCSVPTHISDQLHGTDILGKLVFRVQSEVHLKLRTSEFNSYLMREAVLRILQHRPVPTHISDQLGSTDILGKPVLWVQVEVLFKLVQELTGDTRF